MNLEETPLTHGSHSTALELEELRPRPRLTPDETEPPVQASADTPARTTPYWVESS